MHIRSFRLTILMIIHHWIGVEATNRDYETFAQMSDYLYDKLLYHDSTWVIDDVF